MKNDNNTKIKDVVKNRYAELITSKGKVTTSCCSASTGFNIPVKTERSCCSQDSHIDELTNSDFPETLGYNKSELNGLPTGAVQNSFGCGAPLLYTDIKEGDVVLDLGSGAGLDILLASKKVGKTGKAIGLDMTPEMIRKAKKNAQQMNAGNVEFKLGEIENIPIEDNKVDWIISNCVINLSPDKLKVFKEAFRVLKPGGKMIVSDIVAEGLPDEIKSDLSSWAACIAGALSEDEYWQAIKDAGFGHVELLDKVIVEEKMFAEMGVPVCGEIASVKVRAIKL